MAFKLRSGNKSPFKNIGSSPVKDMKTGKYEHSFESPAKHYVDDVPDHNDGHPDDLQSSEEHETWRKENEKPTKSPAKQYKKSTGPRAEKKPFDYKNQSREINAMVSGIKADSAYIQSGIPSPKAGYLGEKGRHKRKSPAKQTDTTYVGGAKKSKREQDFAERYIAEQAKDKYWYKINNKTATKAQYVAYQNKPGGDEPGKQTNDPDAMGYKAKRKADRAKLNK